MANNTFYKYTIDEYASEAERLNKTDVPIKSKVNISGDSASEEFSKSKDLADALQIMRNGYKDAADKMNITAAGVSQRRANKLSVVGVPVVPLLLQNRPLCMMRRQNVQVKNNLVTIYINISYAACIEANEIVKYSESVLNFAEGARAKNQVKIYAVFASKDTRVTQKSTNTNIDIIEIYDSQKANSAALISFALCHPSMLRRLGFAHLRKLEAWESSNGYQAELSREQELRYFGAGSYYIKAHELKQYRPDYSDAIVK